MFFSLVALNLRQRYRLILPVLLVVFALLSFRHITDAFQSLGEASVFGLFILAYILHMCCVLCMEKYVLPRATTAWDWKAAYKMMFNGRWRVLKDKHRMSEYAHSQHSTAHLKK